MISQKKVCVRGEFVLGKSSSRILLAQGICMLIFVLAIFIINFIMTDFVCSTDAPKLPSLTYNNNNNNNIFI